MKIGIMTCRKLMGRCSGTGCFKAFNNREKAFEIYKNKEVSMESFFFCIGCNETMTNFEDWNWKINQLKKNNIDTIHIAICIKVECSNYNKHEAILKANGFNIVHGSH